MDNRQIMQWSGNNAFTSYKLVNIPGGNHTIRWVYDKQVNINSGNDRGFVRNIQLVEKLKCFGTLASDPTVCSGQGSCVMDANGNGICTCNKNYFS
jgi:hypothetical protein